MKPVDGIDDELRRAARVFAQVPSMADEVMRRIGQSRARKGLAADQPEGWTLGTGRLSLSRNWRIAAACVAGLVLLATGWAAEKVVRSGHRGDSAVEKGDSSSSELRAMADGANASAWIVSAQS